jgi:hypothetical protein
LASGIERLIAAESAPSASSHLAFGLTPGFVEQHAQRHAGVFDAMHHAMGVLAAVELRAAPLHAGVRGAFEEVDTVHAREALQAREREDQLFLDQPVHDQPVVFRIDLGDAAMMALEAQPVRRDDAVELVQRREADRGLAAGGQPLHITAMTCASCFDGLP